MSGNEGVIVSADGDAKADRWWGDPKLLDDEPAAVAATEAFRKLVASGDVELIRESLEVVWMSVDRAALWLSSQHLEWAAREGKTVAQTTCLMTLPTLIGHVRAVTTLARSDLSLLPSALVASRSAFETGLRIAWVFSTAEETEAETRALRLHRETANWKIRVATHLEESVGTDGVRWREAAAVHEALIERASELRDTVPALPRAASVREQLRGLNLERLYLGYRLSSEHAHGGLASGGEIMEVKREHSPYGTYWPQDWQLAVNMCAWACVFVAEHFPWGTVDVGPVRGAMWAADLLHLVPGYGDDFVA